MWVLLILLGALASFTYIILYNGGVTLKKTNSTEVILKLKDIQVKGGNFGLTQEDINELCSIYLDKPKSMGDITLWGINIELLNGKILIEAPITYKKLNLLITSTGKMYFSNGEIVYDADNFKIGKLKLPKNLLISKILNFKNKVYYVENNSIKIYPDIFPFNIDNFIIANDKMVGIAEKLNMNMLLQNNDKNSIANIDKKIVILEQKIQKIKRLMNVVEKEKIKAIQNTIEGVKGKPVEEKNKVISDAVNRLDKVLIESRDSEKKKELEKQRAIIRISLIKVKNELSNVYSQVVTPRERKLIAIMSTTLSKMIANSSYNATLDKASIKSIYSTLDPTSKDRVKSALFWNIDWDSIGQLRQAFGI